MGFFGFMLCPVWLREKLISAACCPYAIYADIVVCVVTACAPTGHTDVLEAVGRWADIDVWRWIT